jgi:hypothetical protein
MRCVLGSYEVTEVGPCWLRHALGRYKVADVYPRCLGYSRDVFEEVC